MLVLSRKPGEQVALGNGITLTGVEVRGDRVRLARRPRGSPSPWPASTCAGS
jgi:sRNA-binding carbon storage regulator CsrA